MAQGSPERIFTRIKRLVIGGPRDLSDQSIFHRLSLIPFLAWVGLGADGLSSSAYGPEETFKALGLNTYLAVPLVLLMGFTVFIISAAYSRIIEAFPHGGGGYVVASKLLGKKTGVVSGCALLVDYVLTITISIAAAGDALFSFLPTEYHSLKIAVEIILIIGLTTLNLRGVKESVVILAPIFLIFLITHAIAIGWGIIGHAPEFPATISTVGQEFQNGIQSLGPLALVLLMFHAYSLGGGTYTGIEAVSNGLPIMREPKVQTAKRTMLYMGTSLAITASGLLFCYLLWNITPIEGKTMNAVFLEKLVGGLSFGPTFVIIALIAEGLLLVVAAQAGFIDGPRVLANMAIDSWMPKRLAALSERLTTANGIFIMGAMALVALLYTHGNVSHLVVMYSINVFLTFSLSIFGMLKSNMKAKDTNPRWGTDFLIFAIGFILCVTILTITIFEKFGQGGWITLSITGAVVLLSFYIRKHYFDVSKKLMRLDPGIDQLPKSAKGEIAQLDPESRTAAIFVASYGGLGLHTLKSIIKTFPDLYKNFIFVSVGVIDSGGFKGEGAVDNLKVETETMLKRYITLCRELGYAADYRMAVGTDVVQEGHDLCLQLSNDFSAITFFAGKVVFEADTWFNRLLHNETAFSLQKRLQLDGLTMVVLPAKVA